MGRRTQIAFSIKDLEENHGLVLMKSLSTEDFKNFPPFCSASLLNGAESLKKKNEEILHLPLCAIREPLMYLKVLSIFGFF